jgi:hypothetical protein
MRAAAVSDFFCAEVIPKARVFTSGLRDLPRYGFVPRDILRSA